MATPATPAKAAPAAPAKPPATPTTPRVAPSSPGPPSSQPPPTAPPAERAHDAKAGGSPTTPSATPPPPAPAVQRAAFSLGVKRGRTYLKMMVYGAYGAGKTVLAATADDVPEMYPVVYVDIEAGRASLSDRPELVDDRMIEATSYDTLATIIEWLERHCVARDRNDETALRQLQRAYTGVEPGESVQRFNTVVIDSLSEVQRLCMLKLLGVDFRTRSIVEAPDSPEWKEWNESSGQLEILMLKLRHLPMNVILTCAELHKEIDIPGPEKIKRKRSLYTPALPGRFVKDSQKLLDVVGRLTTGMSNYTTADGKAAQRVTRRVYLQPSATFDAKNRLRALPDTYVDDPTMETFYAPIRAMNAANE